MVLAGLTAAAVLAGTGLVVVCAVCDVSPLLPVVFLLEFVALVAVVLLTAAAGAEVLPRVSVCVVVVAALDAGFVGDVSAGDVFSGGDLVAVVAALSATPVDAVCGCSDCAGIGTLRVTTWRFSDGVASAGLTCPDTLTGGLLRLYSGSGGILEVMSPEEKSPFPVSNMGMKMTPREINTMAPTSRCFKIVSTQFLTLHLLTGKPDYTWLYVSR